MMSKSPGGNKKKKNIFFFELPLQIICNRDISKSIIFRSFKLCELIVDDE